MADPKQQTPDQMMDAALARSLLHLRATLCDTTDMPPAEADLASKAFLAHVEEMLARGRKNPEAHPSLKPLLAALAPLREADLENTGTLCGALDGLTPPEEKAGPPGLSDKELVRLLAGARDSYAMQEDGDGARLGRVFFEAVGNVLKELTQEIFKRHDENATLHPGLEPALEKLAPLDPAARADVTAIYNAVYDLRLPQKSRAAAIANTQQRQLRKLAQKKTIRFN